MNLAYEKRASTILYNLLVSRPDRRPFLLPANICPIVPITFLKAGMPFEFVDVSAATLHMDLDLALEQLNSARFGGVLYAHTYGETSTPTGFFAAARELDPSLLLIDDRCLCPPDAQPDAGMMADITLYSTGYAKVVELGWGGYAFVNESVPYQRAHLPFDPSAYEDVEKGYKDVILKRTSYCYRDSNWLDTDRPLLTWQDYFANLGNLHSQAMLQRRTINSVYASRLPAEIQMPAAYQLWRFNILIPGKESILKAIFSAGLFASSHYASLAGIFSPGNCPEADKLSGAVINLFNDHHYTAEMAEKTCKIILNNL